MSEPDSRVGSMFGPYHLKRLLGRGGMGEVYEAEHTVKEWTVAVKLMTAEFSKDAVFRERMKREARIAGRLQEPHVVPIHDYGEIDGQMYLEMRMIEGTDLDSVLKRYGPLTPPRAVAIITQIAAALDAAHAAGVMHRDVKPPNILVTGEDFAYLVDFGIASATTDEKLTQLGTAVGTWKYMAPERFSNDEVTYRADIYALACVLYECLTGSAPYRADSATTLVTAHLMDPVPQASAARAGIPKSLDAVIARGMAKKPEDRYASAGDFARAAHDALSNPDQDHAENILRRSRESTLPGTVAAPQHTPQQSPPQFSQPPSYGGQPGSGPLQAQQPSGAPSWNPPSGPVSPPSQPVSTPQYMQSGGWGGTPPPQQPSGATQWNQGQPSGGKRSPLPIIAGVVGLVIVLVVAAVGIWLVTKKDDSTTNADNTTTSTPSSSSSRGPTSTTTSKAPTTSTPNDPKSKLMSMLPAGYASGACTATTPKPDTVWAGTIAMVDCQQNSNAGGPSRGIYGLFPNLQALKAAFDSDINAVDLTSCPPGNGPSPDSWHYDRDPNTVAGQIACGTYKNHPNLIWSNEGKLILNDVFGDPATLDDLHTWWTKFG